MSVLCKVLVCECFTERPKRKEKLFNSIFLGQFGDTEVLGLV